MRQRTKAELTERCERLERENTLLGYALTVAMRRDTPEVSVKWREGNEADSYEVRLYHPTAPHGGFVIVTFRYPGQKDSHSVYYADQWSRDAYDAGIHLGYTERAAAAGQVRRAMQAAQRATPQ